MCKVAVMQPYFFPYLGYFQLINCSDKFVVYDDVNFIKSGWINRNRILINGVPRYFTVSLKKASPNKLINEIEVSLDTNKLLKTLKLSYKKAPYFDSIYPIVKKVLTSGLSTIDELATLSLMTVSNYLEIDTEFIISSKKFPQSKDCDRADRLIEITKSCGCRSYVNSEGGKKLYSKDYFLSKGISLSFLNSKLKPYQQFGDEFHKGLSIIDVLMFNSCQDVKTMLENYKLD